MRKINKFLILLTMALSISFDKQGHAACNSEATADWTVEISGDDHVSMGSTKSYIVSVKDGGGVEQTNFTSEWSSSVSDNTLDNETYNSIDVTVEENSDFQLEITIVLDSGEFVNTQCEAIKDVKVCDLRCSEIRSRRTNAGIAEAFFEINEGEHYEIGGTFEFKLFDKDSTDDHLSEMSTDITYELWDLDFLDDELETGNGSSFTHTFVSGDHGDAEVWFYFDSNGDEEWNYIMGNEEGIDGTDFYVQNVTTYNIRSQFSDIALGDEDPTKANAIVESYLEEAWHNLIIKDSQDDYRACVRFNSINVNVFEANKLVDGVITKPDPVVTYDDCFEHFDHPDDFTWVSQIDYHGASGLAVSNNWHAILLSAGISPGGVAHEFGHGVGLAVGDEHAGYSPQHIMYGSDNNSKELKETDVDNYE